jgi:hypothetical protein
MIIYGTRATHLKTEAITGVCGNCSTENSIHISAYQRYAHIFWIPLFPIGKVYATQCGHCKQVLEEKEIRSTYRTAYEDLKNQLRVPIWTFSGLGIVACLVVFAVFAGQKKDAENMAYIQAPQEGDIYEYKTEDGEYSLLKVATIDGDTVFVIPNKYAATKSTGLAKLEAQGDSTFSDEMYPMMRSELVNMVEKNEILEVIRP